MHFYYMIFYHNYNINTPNSFIKFFVFIINILLHIQWTYLYFNKNSEFNIFINYVKNDLITYLNKNFNTQKVIFILIRKSKYLFIL